MSKRLEKLTKSGIQTIDYGPDFVNSITVINAHSIIKMQVLVNFSNLFRLMDWLTKKLFASGMVSQYFLLNGILL